MKLALRVLLTLALLLNPALALAGQYDSYKVTASERGWWTKYNLLVDAASAIYSSVAGLSTLITNWVTTENQDILVPGCTYASATSFTVAGDLTGKFTANAKVRFDLGSGTLKGSYVDSSSYGAGTTTVNIHDSILTNPLSGVWVTATRNGLYPYGPGYVVARDYGTPGQTAIDNAVTAIGVAQRELRVSPGNWAITSNTSTPANVIFKPQSGCRIQVATGVTFTINKLADDLSSDQWIELTGTGKVVFGPGAVKRVDPAWWGISGANDEVAINAAIASLGSTTSWYGTPKAVIDLTGRTFNINNEILVDKDFIDLDARGTVLNHTGAGNVIRFNGVIEPKFTGGKIILNTDDAAVIGINVADCRKGKIQAEVAYSNDTTIGTACQALHLEPPAGKYIYGNRIEITARYVGWMVKLITPDSFSTSAVQANYIDIFGFLCGNGLYNKGCQANEINFLDLELYTGSQTFLEFRANGNATPVPASNNILSIIWNETHNNIANNDALDIRWPFDSSCENNLFRFNTAGGTGTEPGAGYAVPSIPNNNVVEYVKFGELRQESGASFNREMSGGVVQSPNYLPKSEDFSSGWTYSNLSVTPAADIAPDGTTTANLLTQTANGGNLNRWCVGITAGDVPTATWTGSVWLKAATPHFCKIQLNSAWSGPGTYTHNRSVWVTTEWKRFHITGTFPGTTGTNVTLLIRPSLESDTTTKTALAWGAQVEKGHLGAYQPNYSTTIRNEIPGGVATAGGLSALNLLLTPITKADKHYRIFCATSMPSSGTFTAGDICLNMSRTESGSAGSKYLVLGWSRKTTGSNHVLNTDWNEMRVLTGN